MLWWMLLGCPFVTESYRDEIRDQDGDGFAATSFDRGRDCDDEDPDVHPDATETWYDGIDQDCDGADDFDQDGDGLASSDYGGTDCDDTRATIGDEQLLLGPDVDEDGFAAELTLQCANTPAQATRDGDCDDENPNVHPEAVDTWYDGIDSDCDERNDFDQDGDEVPVDQDCDDLDPDVTTELTYYVDDDGDGFGIDATTVGGCEPGPNQAHVAGDCDDDDYDVHPDAVELCDDEDEDENCNGLADDQESPPNRTLWFIDADGDGYGDPAITEERCDGDDVWIDNDEDCDDSEPAYHPGAQWFFDKDRDGYGDPEDAVTSCLPVPNRVAEGSDCNDDDGEVNPDEVDLLYDFVDQDCDGALDMEFDDEGHPLPMGAWSSVPIPWDSIAPCSGPRTYLHVGAGAYSTINDALADAETCDTVVVHAGTYAPFQVMDTPGIVISAHPGDVVVVEGFGSNTVDVDSPNVVLHGLGIEGTSQALVSSASIVLIDLDLYANQTNISVAGHLIATGLTIEAGIGAISHSGGDLDVSDMRLNGVIGSLGALTSLNPGHDISIRNLDMTSSTGLVGAALLLAGRRIDLSHLDFDLIAGGVIDANGERVTARHIEITNGVLTDAAAVKIHSFLTTPEQAILHDLRASGNQWTMATPPVFNHEEAFVSVDDFPLTLVDDIVLTNNVLYTNLAVQPVWLRSIDEALVSGGTRLLQHITIAGQDPTFIGGPTGIGVMAQSAELRNATLVGLDSAIWPVFNAFDPEPFDLIGSILWDNDALYVDDDFHFWAGMAPSSVVDVGHNDPSCGGCPQRPGFLRYHPRLPMWLWDLQLHRDGPFYRYGSTLDTTATCDDPGAVDEQIGAYGNQAIAPSDLLTGLELELGHEGFTLTDPRRYDDCDDDGMYDRWEATYDAFEPLDDLDEDGHDNLGEFEAGTLPTSDDTDGDGQLDGAELVGADDMPGTGDETDPLDPDDP